MRRGHSRLVRFGLATFLGLCALLVNGCSLGASNQPTPLPPAQQILRLGLLTGSHDLHTLDPARAFNFDDGAGFITSLIFPPLLTVDDHLNPKPWSAAGMSTFDATTNTYTFHVKPGLTWSDGTPIDASTYAYSLNRSLSPCTNSPSAAFLYPIQDAEAYSLQTCGPDGTTVQGKIKTLLGDSLLAPNSQTLLVKLAAPAPYLLSALTAPVGFAQPEQLIERYGNRTWTQHLADNGGFGGNLYRVKSWDHNGELNLVACGASCGAWPTRSPHLRELDFRFYQTAEQEQTAYHAAALDVASMVSPVSRVLSNTTTFVAVPTLQVTALQLNWARAPFDDLRARQAFALALDKDRLAQLLGLIPTNHIVPAGMAGYDPMLVGPDGTTTTTGNVGLARQLLQTYADARCRGQFSRCPPVFLPFSLPCSGFDPMDAAAMREAVQMWQQAFPGYPVTAGDSYCGVLQDSIVPAWLPQVFGAGWNADYADPQDWLSWQFGPTPGNWGSVNVPAAIAQMAEADQALDPSYRTELYHQAEQLLVTDVAWIPIGQSQAYYALRPAVAGFALTELGYPSLDQVMTIELVKR